MTHSKNRAIPKSHTSRIDSKVTFVMESKKYTASRVSEGNRLFPAEIHIEETEITLKLPGFFSGKSRHIVYQQIEGVNIDTPMIGYSTITFVVGGEKLVGHGFAKNEVKEIKQICSEKIFF